MQVLIGIFIGGGLGSISRFGLSKYITSNFHNINPIATLTSNVISTLILGMILFISSNKFEMNATLKAMIIVGFCGGFSTFSTFSYETFELIKTGNYSLAIINLLVSILLGLAVLFILARSL